MSITVMEIESVAKLMQQFQQFRYIIFEFLINELKPEKTISDAGFRALLRKPRTTR